MPSECHHHLFCFALWFHNFETNVFLFSLSINVDTHLSLFSVLALSFFLHPSFSLLSFTPFLPCILTPFFFPSTTPSTSLSLPQTMLSLPRGLSLTRTIPPWPSHPSTLCSGHVLHIKHIHSYSCRSLLHVSKPWNDWQHKFKHISVFWRIIFNNSAPQLTKPEQSYSISSYFRSTESEDYIKCFWYL